MGLVQGRWGYAFGNINYLVNSCGPLIVGGLIYAAMGPNKKNRYHLALLAGGLAILIAFAVFRHRRGVTLALIAAATLLALRPLLLRYPRWAVVGGLSCAALGTAAILPRILGAYVIASSPDVRWSMYRGVLGLCTEAFPWGFGSYGALHLADCPHEWARALTQTGGWFFHPHNEFLDAFVNGGVPGLLLFIAAIALIGRHVIRITDPALQAAAMAIAIMAFVHMMTSVVYGSIGGRILFHQYAAIILLMPGRSATRPLLLPVRTMVWPLVIYAAWWSAQSSAPGLLHNNASPGANYRAAVLATNPNLFNSQLLTLYLNLDTDGFLVIGEHKIPPEDYIPRLRHVAGPVGAIHSLETRAVITNLKRLHVGMTQGVDGAEQALAQARAMAAPILTGNLTRFPHSRSMHAQVRDLLLLDSAMADTLPKHIINRIRLYDGDSSLDAPNLDFRPTDIEGLAKLHAGINWHIVNGTDWDTISPAMEHLVKRAGDVSDVASLALQALIHAENRPSFRWMDQYMPMIGRALKPVHVILALRSVNSPQRARAIWPFLEILFADYLDPSTPNGGSQSSDCFWMRIMLYRIKGMSKWPDTAPNPDA
ncbi:MAG: O-antigen ligase family protein [Planctomycetota bacterium]|nr:O-antigen ligase family protein [Planctomycetota bacterium]